MRSCWKTVVSRWRLACVVVSLVVATVVSAATAGEDQVYLTELLVQARQAELAASRYWHLLLHYRPSVLRSGYTSAIDAPEFFLAPHGKTDPHAELEATLSAFFSSEEIGRSQQPAQCAYIARYHWLQSVLSIDERRLPAQPCERFQHWFDDLNPEAVTLVFPAAYMNNPASMFGHTLLRVDQRGQTEQTRLLASSINFGAKDTSSNWLSYGVSGVGGGFQGHFFIMPYYQLVREYGDFEDRDIWEYRLRLAKPQLTRLLMHVWELKDSYFDYFFFTENCSYQLLPLLEVANPALYLSGAFSAWTIPADTVRLIMQQPGFVSEVTYRPAPSTQIRRARSSLSPTEQQALSVLLGNPAGVDSQSLTSLPPRRQAATLDLAISYLHYQHAKKKKRGLDTKQDHLHRLLVSRSRLNAQQEELAIDPFVTRPDRGHDSLRVGLGIGWRQDDWFEEVSVRAAYHDLLDPDPGYTPDAQIDVLALSLRHYHERNRIRLERLTLVDAISLSPVESFFIAPSWKVRALFNTLNRDGHRYRQNLNLNGGIGVAAQTQWGRREVYFVFPELDANVSRAFDQTYRAGGGGTIGVLANVTSRWKILASATYLRYPVGDAGEEFQVFLGQRYTLHRNLALRFEFRHRKHDNEAMLQLHVSL